MWRQRWLAEINGESPPTRDEVTKAALREYNALYDIIEFGKGL